MAIKASATVTISCYRDTQSVTRYYKLQSSTATAPAKPTVNPPSGWTDAEPPYTSGSTNTLYFCDLSVFSDGTWSYSTVSKSSSYEAAKEAYNKAVAAQNTANDAQTGAENAQTTADMVQDSVDNVETRVTDAESALLNITNIISTLVVDENGRSLMEQTSNGWVFSMASTLSKLNDATDGLNDLTEDVGNLDGKVGALQNVTKNLELLGNYVMIKTDGDQPYLELGNAGDFKVRITNTDIQFMEGSAVPASINNQRLDIRTANIENELQFGNFVFAERENGNMGFMWRGA